MAAPTRYPAGVSTETVGTALGNLPFLNPNRIVDYDNDFLTYVAGDWTLVADGGSTAIAITAGTGGRLRLSAATSGAGSMQLKSNAFAFQPSTAALAGTQFWFQTGLILDATVANPDYMVGMMKGAIATFNAATDGVYFTKASGAPVAGTTTGWNIVLKAAAGGTSTFPLPAITLPVSSDTISLSYYYDAKPNPTLYVFAGCAAIGVNDVLVGTLGNGASGYNNPGSLGTAGVNNLANLPGATVLLTPSFYNGFHTGTSVLDIDYVLAACEYARV
jgi:hypothetical protein